MSNHSVIEHRANYHFLKLEEDYVLICSQGKQYPHCKAFILAILEQWTNDKLSKGQSPHIYMTYPQWIDALYGLFRRNHVIDCLAELIQEKLIFRQPCRLHGKDTFEYILNVQEVQSRLSKLPERTEKYTRPNINPFKFKRVEKQTGVNLDGSTDTNLNGSEHDDPSKFGRNIDSPTEIPSNIDSTREVATATARSQTSSQNDLSEETVKREAVKPSQKEVTHDTSGDNPADIHLRNNDTRAHSHANDPALAKQKENTNAITQPPAPRKPPANPTIPKRPRPQQQELKDTKPVESELSSEATAIMDKWDSVNKRPVPRTASVIEGATLLIPCNPTAEELDTCKKWLFTTDDPKKPWFRKIGVGLLDVAKNFSKWQSLQEVQPAKPPGKEESNEHKTSNFYSAQSVIERNKWKMEAFQAEYEAKTAAMQEVQS